jgi:amino acid transporter
MATLSLKTRPPDKKLGELASTAICGNDITSSCLYVSALSIGYSGRWAPLALLIVALVPYFYRSIYSEVVGALPLNGGAYNALLNTTSKFRASFAACLTILSYMATAVISGSEAMHYAHTIWASIPVQTATVVLLAFFMVLTIVGITESSRVAVGIFLFHLSSMALLVVFCGLWSASHGTENLITNFSTPVDGGWKVALYFGFCAAMLGISGFESSANFVEEQKDGVFPKTLRNMWLAVSILNPLLAFTALALLPLGTIAQEQEALLAVLGGEASGNWLSLLISVDAVLVLSGAVLTSFVGVNGLVHRMALDRCLPQFLLKQNRRGTTHRILIVFFLLCTSVYFSAGGDLKELAGVYTISFLAVMALFAIGNVLLKIKRKKLARPHHASWLVVLLGLMGVLAGMVGNIVLNPSYLRVFFEFLIPTLIIVSIMLGRVALLDFALVILHTIMGKISAFMGSSIGFVNRQIERVESQQFVFFTRGDNLANLNQVMLYILRNEHTNRVKIVHVKRPGELESEKLAEDVKFLDEAYPDIEIELVNRDGQFGPELIAELSREWDIPPNLMFIGSPEGRLKYSLAELGGVRLII